MHASRVRAQSTTSSPPYPVPRPPLDSPSFLVPSLSVVCTCKYHYPSPAQGSQRKAKVTAEIRDQSSRFTRNVCLASSAPLAPPPPRLPDASRPSPTLKPVKPPDQFPPFWLLILVPDRPTRSLIFSITTWALPSCLPDLSHSFFAKPLLPVRDSAAGVCSHPGKPEDVWLLGTAHTIHGSLDFLCSTDWLAWIWK